MKNKSISAISIFVVALTLLTVAIGVLAATTGWLYPVADGYYKQWTTSTSTVHYVLVDETNCNTTDYVYSTNTGKYDSYRLNISSIPNTSTITRIDVVPCGSSWQSSGIDPRLTLNYRYNGVNSTSTKSQSIFTTTTVPYALATGTWTSLSLPKRVSTTLEIIIQNSTIGTSTSRGIKISNLKTLITY